MDAQFNGVRTAAYNGDFDGFVAALEVAPELITATSKDPGDSPNLIQFVIVEGGLGKIPEAHRFLSYLIEHGSTTERQLIAAASVNARDLVDILLQAGCRVDEDQGWTVVDESAYWARHEMADYLIHEHGAQISSLAAAAALGRLELVQTFFNDGQVDPAVLPLHNPWGPLPTATEADAIGQAFILAVRHGHLDVGQFLLDIGMDINAIPQGHHEDSTALHQAAGAGDRAVVDWLIDRGAIGTVKDARFNATAAQWADHQGHGQLAEHIRERLPE